MKLNNEDATEYFDYLRTRIRLCRSAGFNFGMITLTSIIFTLIHVSGDIKWLLLSVEIIIGLGLNLSAFYSWKLLTETFAKSIAKRYKGLEKNN